MNKNNKNQHSLFRIPQFSILLLSLVLLLSCNGNQEAAPTPQWPETSQQTKPWTRWWWEGSAVNQQGLKYNMENLQKNGFGGVEITPIYGVHGYEKEDIPFQSPQWMQQLSYTLKEGKQLDLGVDLSNASGWPFGGNWVGADDACKNVHYITYSLKGGQRLNKKIEYIQEPMFHAVSKRISAKDIRFPISSTPNLQSIAPAQIRFKRPLPLQALVAYGPKHQTIDLTNKVDKNGHLKWTAPTGNWKLYAVFEGWHGKMVERAGLRGEGNVIDHFSSKAVTDFLSDYDKNSQNIPLDGLRAFFNDSYEVDDAHGNANWTPEFFSEFQKRRGYDLRTQLPALFGNSSEELNSRVICDYRETISDLLRDDFTKTWTDWSHKHHAVSRNQSHGSPANILDLYAASDIPETEGIDVLRIKMASSAGHVMNKPLISCEACTWLNEHFRATLQEVKQNVDRYLANGINHIVYHGTPYSPENEKWPGWMFYAAVNFAPANTWWNDLKSLNQYITNCQSFLQNSLPDNDILLYFPIFDKWSEPGKNMLIHFGEPNESLAQTISNDLLKEGYTFDYISDLQIQSLQSEQKLIKAPGANYKTIIVPACDYMPLETFQKLLELAQKGATVIFMDHLPVDVPGLNDLSNRQQKLTDLTRSLQFRPLMNVDECAVGEGHLLKGKSVDDLLNMADIHPEELAKLGLWFNRVKRAEGNCYFITNWSDKSIHQWISFQESGKNAAIFNPQNHQSGKAQTKKGNKTQKIYLQLNPGETLIVQWFPYSINLENYHFWKNNGSATTIGNQWTVCFPKGIPSIKDTLTETTLASWTQWSDSLKYFSGTGSYHCNFNSPSERANAYRLNLGQVNESATVYLNNQLLGTLIGPDYQLIIPSSLIKKQNDLRIDVSNLMANHIIEMDKNKIPYKKFYNVNFAAKIKSNKGHDGLFTAANWSPLPSGLQGPVTLTPLKLVHP